MKKVFTTGEVAKICKVTPATVARWVDRGELEGYRIGINPESGDRRIPRESLTKFAKGRGIPLGDLEDEGMAKVLIVSQNQVLIENLEREMPEERSFEVATASNAFKAGMETEKSQPDCIIIDFSIGLNSAIPICQSIRISPGFTETILIALLPDYDSPPSFDRSTINETFKKPLDPALVAERIRTLVGAKKNLPTN